MIHKNEATVNQTTIFGPLPKLAPVLIKLIESTPFQRLKNIHQYGVSSYSTAQYPFSRYEHSLGVLHLLVKANVSLAEQIAGLLHDVSHTVFSHVGDVIFEKDSQSNSYQDNIHEWYLNQTEIPTILNDYGFTVSQILHKNSGFKALEQDLPWLCADRLEYILHGSLLEQQTSSAHLSEIINSLHFDGDQWYFSDVQAARFLALQALFLTEYLFTTAWNLSGYYWAASALKRALKSNLISLHEIHFSHDSIVWDKLFSSNDYEIKELIHKIKNSKKYYQVATQDNFDIYIKPKFRGVDPYVRRDNKLYLLSEIDNSFATEFYALKNKLAAGLYLKL